jgi:hypothetical protein
MGRAILRNPLVISAALIGVTGAGVYLENHQIRDIWLLGVLLTLGSLIYFLARAAVLLWRSHVRRSLPYLASVAGLAGFLFALPHLSEVGHLVFLRVHKSDFRHEIAAHGTTDPVLWVYGREIGGGWSQPLFLAYDGSDEITRPENERSEKWKRAAAGTRLACSVAPQRLEDHFYSILLVDC